MWIFGYGSLMSDGWEKRFAARQRLWGDLPGYRRAFNKKSVKNWGTNEAPGLTLNLEQIAGATCRGIAIKFDDDVNSEELLTYLKNREACDPTKVGPVLVDSGATVEALTYIYNGRNLLARDVTLQQKAAMVLKATGKSGTSRDYVRRTFEDLQNIGVDDPAVTQLWEAVNA
jgi:cation transport protein ChaC